MFNNRIQTSMLVVLVAIVALNITAGSPPALAQFEFAKLLASDGLEGDGFGYSVALSGDFDADGDVDLTDFAIFASAWLTESGKTGWNPDCDINVPADKSVGMLDLIVFVEHWLTAFE